MQQQTETALEENKKKHSTVGGILSGHLSMHPCNSAGFTFVQTVLPSRFP